MDVGTGARAASTTEDTACSDLAHALQCLSLPECRAEATRHAQSGNIHAAIACASRAITLAEEQQQRQRARGSDGSDSDTFSRGLQGEEALQRLYLRRAGYYMTVPQFQEALLDAQRAATPVSDKQAVAWKAMAAAYRSQCHALVALGRVADARTVWKEHFGHDSGMLDELAFQQAFASLLTANTAHGSVHLDEEDEEDEEVAQIRRDTALAVVKYGAALTALYRRDYGNAISTVSKTLAASKIHRRDPVLYLMRARARFLLGEYEGVVSDAERVITLLPTASDAYRWLGAALRELKQYKQARQVCLAGLRVTPTNDTLRELLNVLPTDPKSDSSTRKKRTNKTERTSKNGGVPSAKKSVTTEHTVPTTGKNELDAEQEARFIALRTLKKDLKADPGNAGLLCRRAGLRLEMQQFELAQQDASAAIARDASYVEAYVCSCDALFQLGRFAKGVKVCESGLALAPTHSGLLQRLEPLQRAVFAPRKQVKPACDHEQGDTGVTETFAVEATLEPATPARSRGRSHLVGRIPPAVAERRRSKADRRVNEAMRQCDRCLDCATELVRQRDYGNAVSWATRALTFAETVARGAEIRAKLVEQEEHEEEEYREQDDNSMAATRFVVMRDVELLVLRARCRCELQQFELVREDGARALRRVQAAAEYRYSDSEWTSHHAGALYRLATTFQTMKLPERALEACSAGLAVDMAHAGLVSLQAALSSTTP